MFGKSRGYWAGLIFILVMWLTESLLAWKYEGVRDIAIVTYIVCIFIAVNIFRYRLAVIISVLSLLSVWGLVYAEYNHFKIPIKDSILNYGLDYTVWLIIIITLLFLHRNSYLLLYGRIQKEYNEKLNAERSLRERESLVVSINHNLTCGMIYQVIWKPDGTRQFTYLSDSVRLIFGISPQEGKADATLIYDRIHEDDIEFLEKTENEALKSLKVFRAEIRICGPSEEIRWFSLVSTPRLMEDGLICFDGMAFDITDRIMALEELKESRRKERAIMDLSFGFMGLLNPEGTVLDINRTALEFAGIQLSEVKGNPFWETPWWSHSTETQNQIREGINKASKGEFVRDETTHLDKDGKLHLIDFTLKPVFDEKMNVSFLIPEGRDITENKKANEILKESKERFGILSSVGTESLMIHKDGIVIDANQSFAKILGYSSPDDLVGKNAFDFVPFTPESKEIVLDHFLKNSDETYDAELVNLNGSVTVVEIRGIEINYMGTPARLVFMRDITERKKAEDAILKSEIQFRTLYEKASEGIMYLSLNGEIVQINEAYAKMHGYSVEEMWRLKFQDLNIEDITRFDAGTIQRIANGEDLRFEIKHFHKDGHIIVLEVTTCLLPLEKEKFIVAFYRNITGRKLAEEKLRSSEERYRKAQEIGHFGNWEYDIKNDTLLGSEEAKRIYGLNPVAGTFSSDEVTKCIINRDFVSQAYFNLIENGNPFNTVFDIIPCNSTEKRTIQAIGEISRDKSGDPVKVSGVVLDVTELKRSEETVQYQVRLQEMLMNMAAMFIYMPVESVNAVMQSSLMEVASEVDADRIIVFQYNSQKFVANTVNEWTRKEVEPPVGFFNGFPLEIVPANELEKLLRGEPIYISDAQSLSDNRLRSVFIRGGIKCWLAIPMMEHGECLGFVAISWVRSYHAFKEDELRILKVFTLMLVNLQMRKKNHEALMKSEEKFRELVENINDVFYTLNSDGVITYVSPRVTNLFNYKPEELIGHSISEIVHPDDLEDLRMKFYSTMDNNLAPLEFRYLTRSGQKGWAQASSRPIIEDGHVAGIYGLFSDITKRKQDEEAVRKLSLAVEQSPASIVITNLAGEIEYVNPRFTQVTGYIPEEVIGRNPNILKSGHTPSEVYKDLWSQISVGKEWKGEFYNRKKNGELFWEAVSISPIINNKKEITHYLGVKEDITEKKEATRHIFDVIIETEEKERLRYSHELHDGLGPILSTINLYFQMWRRRPMRIKKI